MGRIGAAGLMQFVRFCAVGVMGFVVDAGVLLLAIHVLGIDPIAGRLLSFAIAVLTTFELNRRWAFKAKKRSRYFAALVPYLGVQGFGFCCNFGIYTLLYLFLPPGYNAPLLCLTVASAIALVVNYLGAKLIVFRPERGAAASLGTGATADPVAASLDATGLAAGTDRDRSAADARLARPGA